MAVYISTGRSAVASVFATLFFFTSAPLLELHSWAWSEPLFITCCLTGIFLLDKYVIRPTWLLFLFSSLSFGLAVITRYFGLAFLPAAVALEMAGNSGLSVLQKLKKAFNWLLIACAPLLAFFVRNQNVAHTTTDRSFVYHPLTASDYLSQLSVNVFNFVVPVAIPAGFKQAIIGVLFLMLTVLSIKSIYRRHRVNFGLKMSYLISIASFLFSISYVLFLYLSISFIDSATPVDQRILSPVIIFMVIGAVSEIWNVSQILKKTWILGLLLILSALIISVKLPDAIQNANHIRMTGLGYNAIWWQKSESVAFVRSLPDDMKIYSNGPDVLNFLTEADAIFIPLKTFSDTLNANTHYDEEMQMMCKEIQEGKALLLYSTLISWREYLPGQAELEADCDLPVVKRFADGTIYGAVP